MCSAAVVAQLYMRAIVPWVCYTSYAADVATRTAGEFKARVKWRAFIFAAWLVSVTATAASAAAVFSKIELCILGLCFESHQTTYTVTTLVQLSIQFECACRGVDERRQSEETQAKANAQHLKKKEAGNKLTHVDPLARSGPSRESDLMFRSFLPLPTDNWELCKLCNIEGVFSSSSLFFITTTWHCCTMAFYCKDLRRKEKDVWALGVPVIIFLRLPLSVGCYTL